MNKLYFNQGSDQLFDNEWYLPVVGTENGHSYHLVNNATGDVHLASNVVSGFYRSVQLKCTAEMYRSVDCIGFADVWFTKATQQESWVDGQIQLKCSNM